MRSGGNGGSQSGFRAIPISLTGLSSAATRLELNAPHRLHRWTTAHSPFYILISVQKTTKKRVQNPSDSDFVPAFCYRFRRKLVLHPDGNSVHNASTVGGTVPGSTSKCRLERQLGQWLRCSLPAPSGVTIQPQTLQVKVSLQGWVL